MPYLYSPNKSVTGVSWNGVELECLQGRFWVEDEAVPTLVESHGLAMCPDQSEGADAEPEVAEVADAEEAPTEAKPASKYKK